MKMSDGPVSYLSNIEAAGAEKKAWKEAEDPRARVQETEELNGAPENYDGFIDSDGFDGGDGQVGVVGDGTNAMETFDTSQSVKSNLRSNAIGGTESKQTQKVAWGYSTGYADDLAKKGMVDIDEYGEDRLKARRQQLENWQNQNEIRAQKQAQMNELAQLQGKSLSSGGAQSYFDVIAGPEKKAAPAPSTTGTIYLEPKATSDGHIEIHAPFNGRGGTTIQINNEYSTYSDFRAGFAPGSHPAFTVEPAVGTLNRRGGQPQEFIFKFKPETVGQTEYRAVFVVETEDHKW
eukprot:CAMPEP_0197290960 /NCGR_PEP_ID=MMETSP0890-20130614/10353_1 /TAXON_ID=44058 ORGANISM="Aureoumbra lagunensis, Strain CCMP1510" /NCGR_SAMPLE_ID=MMETSP0890 /ASSEMBLY_ACC=CAM_ASM_000533 /LENGTH=290 /DNA_ID=CAMNT_0042763371 /DNA_START=176 /DNA_END=1045 /DNA_ORIENTATION=+